LLVNFSISDAKEQEMGEEYCENKEEEEYEDDKRGRR